MTGSLTVLAPQTRHRRTKDEQADLDEAVIAAVAADAPVTLRGVYYRVVSAGAVDKTENGYRAIGRRLLALRRDGRVSYDDITDGTRWITKPRSFDGWQDAVADAARSYRRSLWSRSLETISIFSEKDAISGVILPITERWDVALGVLRGYSSESFAYGVADTLDPNRHNVLVQLGDHDPSGVGAWADFSAKVASFADDVSTEFVRLAVTPEQIEEWSLPMRPTKRTDTRARGWVGGSVEVDAIPAPQLRTLLDEYIASFHDDDELDRLEAVEAEERKFIGGLAGIR